MDVYLVIGLAVAAVYGLYRSFRREMAGSSCTGCSQSASCKRFRENGTCT